MSGNVRRVKRCKQCGKGLDSLAYGSATFCSIACGRRYKRQARTSHNAPKYKDEDRACGTCGKVFTASHPRKMYCSDECVEKSRKRRGRVYQSKFRAMKAEQKEARS